MTGFLIVIAFIAFCGLATYVHLIDSGSSHDAIDGLKTDLLIADHRIHHEFHQARRAMNDAAGQSWRNLTG